MVLDRIIFVGKLETGTFYFLLHLYRVLLSLPLEKVHWNRRLLGRAHSHFKAFVDGTDFCIQEPVPFPEKWYSHKFKRPGLRYDVGLSVRSGTLVWAHGPFPVGVSMIFAFIS